MNEIAALYEIAPFMQGDPKKPKVHPWRLSREPKEGRIVETRSWLGVPLALFEDTRYGTNELSWRVLLPADPIPVEYVEVGPGEGRPGIHDQVKRVVGDFVDWPGHTCWRTGAKDKFWCNAISKTNTEMMHRGREAPTPVEGGYLKTDFKVVWKDGAEYAGRFDLQRGGYDGGETFSDSLTRRLMFYSGLHCPYHLTFEQYLQIFNRGPDFQTGFPAACRHVLAFCEL